MVKDVDYKEPGEIFEADDRDDREEQETMDASVDDDEIPDLQTLATRRLQEERIRQAYADIPQDHEWVQLGDPDKTLLDRSQILRRWQQTSTTASQISRGERARDRGEAPLRCLIRGTQDRDIQWISEMQWFEALRWEHHILENTLYWARQLMVMELPTAEHVTVIEGALWNMGENQVSVDGRGQWEAMSSLVSSSFGKEEPAEDLLKAAFDYCDALALFGAAHTIKDTFGVEGTCTTTCRDCATQVSIADTYLQIPGPCEMNSVAGRFQMAMASTLEDSEW